MDSHGGYRIMSLDSGRLSLPETCIDVRYHGSRVCDVAGNLLLLSNVSFEATISKAPPLFVEIS